MKDPSLRLGRADRDPADLLVRRSASYGPDPTSARQARRLLQEALTEADRMRWADAGELALSEVVTNAALHAHTPFDVEIAVHADRLHVEVRDGNPMPPRQRGYDSQATTGRGLALVSALADECGVHSVTAAGKVVWFSLGDRAGAAADAALAAAWGGAHGDDWLEGSWQDSAWDLEAEPGGPGPVPGSRTVTLPSMPATLWLAAVQHHDALLRELVLYLAEHEGPTVDLALADAARGQVGAALGAAVEAAQRAGTARPPVPPGHPTPLPHVPDTLDLRVPVPVHAGASYAALQDALDAAERLAHTGRLLVRPGLPEIVEVRDWLCEQVVAQLAGVPAAPWPGTHARDHEREPEDASPRRAWDDALVRDAERGVVAVDDANRIVAVSRPLAAAVGWLVEDLVGRRVVALIPDRLREAHVAGFTRHLVTGETHILGVPLILPVLHADGSEVDCHVLVEQAPQPGERAMYLAWIEPVPPG